jgi:PAS domain-containing protein
LPSTRQIRDSENEVVSAAADPQLLARAFATFNEAAGSLEKFYAQLQAEVSNLRADLEHANLKLSLSLDENARARAFLTHVLDRLPCGVVVGSPDGRIHLLNPEARRLFELDSEPQPPADLPFCELLTEPNRKRSGYCGIFRIKKNMQPSAKRAGALERSRTLPRSWRMRSGTRWEAWNCSRMS